MEFFMLELAVSTLIKFFSTERQRIIGFRSECNIPYLEIRIFTEKDIVYS